MAKESDKGPQNRHVAGESDTRPKKHICGWRVGYMAAKTYFRPESQIYGRRNRYVPTWRVRYVRNRYVTEESDVKRQKQICG